MLVTNWVLPSDIHRDQKGQITIFFSTTIIVMITLMAFIINIGVFVKAKINLQNATDAAAYAGASVQARQLTNIGYMNWEMRNVFKEWMFKYYVLGGLSLEGVKNPTGGSMDFTMSSTDTGGSDGTASDKYNFPSICIDFANTGSVGLCTRYLIPGLPRWNENVLGMDATTNSFIDAIIAEKSDDCSKRSDLNFLVANSWAYNVSEADATDLSITQTAPQIASKRLGAFPAAFELALRIRNLENQVNFPPKSGVCIQGGASPSCNEGIEDLVAANPTPSTERVYKAFYSAFRNLGSQANSELRHTFTLTELAPLPNDPTANASNSLSRLLIPEGKGEKIYVDLKLQTVNYSTFYTTFASGQGSGGAGGSTSSEGQCEATKVGLPVPGYPLGFVKNPNYLTYYAVKGEATFNGLFNPFRTPVTLTAYAAAKPFGARIGPMLFDVMSDASAVKPKGGLFNTKSSAYISGIDLTNRTSAFSGSGTAPAYGEYVAGTPLPLNSATSKFWVEQATEAVGGWLDQSSIRFGVPNLVYEYPGAGIANNSEFEASQPVQIIQAKGFGTAPTAGLFQPQVFQKIKDKLQSSSGVASVEQIEQAIAMVRAPTLYDAHNYLIPTPETVNKSIGTDSFGFVYTPTTTSYSSPSGDHQIFDFQVYAPLYSDASDTLYLQASDIEGILTQYLEFQQQALVTYKESMNIAAHNIYNMNFSSATNQNTGKSAAKVVSSIPETLLQGSDLTAVRNGLPQCNSMAGKFLYFYMGGTSGQNLVVDTSAPLNCGASLLQMLMSRWSNPGNPDLGENYSFRYALNSNPDHRSLFSAYRPGVEHDAQGNNGVQQNPINGRSTIRVRNFYSTKFTSLSSISNSSGGLYRSTGGAPIFSEGSDKSTDMPKNFLNPIEPGDYDIDLSIIKH